ncbi:hypothetical protein B4099_3349 [Heyndrickxia coagulans]|uniref:Uncharacterized protein n=1 Tax=Heyndrickxia coagulans TaxID=1398 RepID=A0A150K6Y7_HEYCO|nr:hypothetical protein B4099_3349 [Heyndrickxia coagulans]
MIAEKNTNVYVYLAHCVFVYLYLQTRLLFPSTIKWPTGNTQDV